MGDVVIDRIGVDQLSDDALAALGDSQLDELEFGLDDLEEVYCANHDERLAFRWDRRSATWVDVDFEAYCFARNTLTD